MHDVMVIGGGAAGLAAAIQLGRSRRSVVVVDAGEPRNAPAAHMHSYLGYDGRPPSELLATGRDEAVRYGVELIAGNAVDLHRRADGDGYEITLGDGSTLAGRRVLVATGLVDELPDLPGVADQWGRGVLHCPYCHGWEVQDTRIVVLATGPMSGHQAMLFRQLSDRVTVIEHDERYQIEDDDRRRLAARRVRFEGGPAIEVVIEDDAVRGVRLADGRLIEADAVVVAPRFRARAALLRGIGIEPVPAPRGVGEMIETDARGETSAPGVYAAGNVTDVSNQVLQAAAEGSRIAAAINGDLALEDADRAIDALAGDTAEHWDERYAGVQWWSGEPNGSLVAEATSLPAGAALDVGCGEGADAIWLAARGWKVTGLDISQVALDRAAQVADDAGVDIEWVCADVVAEPPRPAAYDLVSVQYPALRRTPDDDAIHALLRAVAPGGVLLVVGHEFAAHDHGHGHRGFDPADYVQPPDVVQHLADGWVIEVDESRPRVRPSGSPGPNVPDRVLRARRSPQGAGQR